MAKILDFSRMHAAQPKFQKLPILYGECVDPAKITYSKMAFFSRPCCPCEHVQMQAHRHVHTDRMSRVRQQQQQHGHGQPRQQTWRCGRFEAAVQVRRTWMMSTVT